MVRDVSRRMLESQNQSAQQKDQIVNRISSIVQKFMLKQQTDQNDQLAMLDELETILVSPPLYHSSSFKHPLMSPDLFPHQQTSLENQNRNQDTGGR